MSYNVVSTPRFERESRKLIKKYPSLKKETLDIIQLLKRKPRLGVSIGHNAFKIRIGIKSKNAGKSSGGRLITYVIDKSGRVFLLSIYDKSVQDSIPDKDIKQMIKEIKQ